MKKGLFAVILACICAMACMFGLVACNGEEQTTAVESVTLNKTELTLEIGGEETLTVTVAPDDATDKAVAWTSDNTAVATVENGKVTAVAAGKATITAKAGDKTASCSVTVNAAITYTVTEDGWNEALDLESISNLTIRVTITQKGATAPMRSIINNLYDDGKWSASQQTLDGDGNVLYENLVYYNLTGGKNEYGAFGADQYYLNNDIWTKQTNSSAYFDDTGFITLLTLVEYADFTFNAQLNAYENDSGYVTDTAHDGYTYAYTDAEVKFIDGKLASVRLTFNNENLGMNGEFLLEASDYGTTTVTLPAVNESV